MKKEEHVRKIHPKATLVCKKNRQHEIEYWYIESEWDGNILGFGSTGELAWMDAESKLTTPSQANN